MARAVIHIVDSVLDRYIDNDVSSWDLDEMRDALRVKPNMRSEWSREFYWLRAAMQDFVDEQSALNASRLASARLIAYPPRLRAVGPRWRSYLP